jgi:hypothetical protein
LNRLLAENDFDSFVEALCTPFYAGVMGRPSIPPGIFFRMTFVGYFEGLPSHRSIAWRCADSRSLAEFLGLGPADPPPDHSSISKTHKRLPKEVFDDVFRFVLRVAARKGLLWGEKLGIDSTTIQANASMKSIVRKDSGKGWKDQAASDGGRGEEPLDDHASDLRNRLSKGLARTPRASATCLDSLWPAHINAGTRLGPRGREQQCHRPIDPGSLIVTATSPKPLCPRTVRRAATRRPPAA